MQRAVVILVLAGVAEAESFGSGDAKAETTSEKAAPPMQEKHSAGMPFESVWHRYLPKDGTEDFAGDAFPGQSGQWLPRVENTSDPKSWRDAFMKVYAKSYMHFAHAEEALPAGPERARDAENITALKRWKARQEAAIKGFVPKEFQGAAKKGTEKRFEQRASEIEAKQNATADATAEQSDNASAAPAFLLAAEAGGRPMKAEAEADKSKTEHYVAQRLPHVARPASPMAWKRAFMREYASSYMQLLDAEDRVSREHSDAPAHAKDCRTLSELRAWREAKEARVRAFVPEGYRSLAEGDVRRKFERREGAIREEAAEQKKLKEQQQKQREHQDGQAPAQKHEHEDAKSGNSTGPHKHASEASEKPQAKAANATLLAADSALAPALPIGRAPFLATVFCLASLATGALVARSRMQRSSDMGSSYLLVTEA